MNRRPKTPPSPPRPSNPDRSPSPSPSSSFASALSATTLAILSGVFILGIGIGIAFSSVASSGPENVATREFIDRAAPNPEICVQYGASAIAMDTRVFLTMNPFSVYISQPKMQPGCVLRSSNWEVLRQRNLISGEQLRECKNRMNTFGFTGTLETSPQINCVYQNDSAQNLFLNQSGSGGAPLPESDKF